MFLVVEHSLHQSGYSYVGDNSLYKLTWIEIFRLVDAARRIRDDMQGVRESSLDKLQEHDRKLRNGS